MVTRWTIFDILKSLSLSLPRLPHVPIHNTRRGKQSMQHIYQNLLAGYTFISGACMSTHASAFLRHGVQAIISPAVDSVSGQVIQLRWCCRTGEVVFRFTWSELERDGSCNRFRIRLLWHTRKSLLANDQVLLLQEHLDTVQVIQLSFFRWPNPNQD